MKRKILASLLGITASLALVASSQGQGFVAFANYAPDVNAPVTFATSAAVGPAGNAVTAGMAVGSEFTAALLYSLDGGTTFNLLTQAQSGNAGYPASFLGVDGTVGNNGAGYFVPANPIVAIPGYTSGSIQFIVQAYHGASYAAAASDWRGQSPVLTLASIATGTTQPGDLVGLQAFTVAFRNPLCSLWLVSALRL